MTKEGGNGVDYSLWGAHGVRPAAVEQGLLGDCWYLATLGAIAENSTRIHKLFSKADQASGVYELQFYMGGTPTKVVIDDQLPQKNYNEWNDLRTQMAHRSDNEAWWVPLAEKAGAKFTGTYENLISGNFGEAFDFLTGYPSANYNHNSNSDATIISKIAEADQNQWVTAAGVYSDGCINGRNALNFVCNHQYIVIQTKNVNGQNFVEMRNPHGSNEYNGTYSDYSQTAEAIALR